jgi:hypothetical protein
MAYRFEPRHTEKRFDVPARSSEIVVYTQNVTTLLEQSRAQMRSKETSAAGDQYSFLHARLLSAFPVVSLKDSKTPERIIVKGKRSPANGAKVGETALLRKPLTFGTRAIFDPLGYLQWYSSLASVFQTALPRT